MEAQSVVVIQDASNEVNLKVFEWALHGLSFKPGDKLTLGVVLHQVITPMGYPCSVDSRFMVGANRRIIEAEVAKKKEEYLNNEELVQIFQRYKSKKVGFNIELAKGSSPKAVALKLATKLKATWVILDRDMKNDEDYFLQKLYCGISRIKRYNRIVRLRGPLHLSQETRDNTQETYTDSIPNSSNEQEELSSIEIFPFPRIVQMNQEQGERQSSPPLKAGCSAPTFDSNQTEETNPSQMNMDNKEISSKQLVHQIKVDQQHQDEEQKESKPLGGKMDTKLKQKVEESNSHITGGGSEEIQEQEGCISYGGAKNFFLGGAQEYIACEIFFNLCNSHE